MKTIDDSFADWEGHVFGYGYGTGEWWVLHSLREFLRLCPADTNYNYEDLQIGVGTTVAWLLINTLAHANIIEYGTSPRFGWLTEEGKNLKAYMESKTDDELEAITQRDENYVPCYPDACNCGPDGYEKGRHCKNPFWA